MSPGGRPRLWNVPVADLVRLGLAIVVCASSAIAYAAARPSAPPPASAVAGTVYGAIVHGKLCQDERRRLPDRGAWGCVSPLPHPASGVTIDSPPNEATRCSHRVVPPPAREWSCLSRVPVRSVFLRSTPAHPVYSGDAIGAVIGEPPTPRSICVSENRDHLTSGVWHCFRWQTVPARVHVVQPVDPGDPCIARDVDPATGVWDCEGS